MPYEEVQRPVAGPGAFAENHDAAILSQAAVLLLLGAQVRGTQTGVERRPQRMERDTLLGVSREDAEEFPVPLFRYEGERLRPEEVRGRLAQNYGFHTERALPEKGPGNVSEFVAAVAESFYKEPTALTAAQLMEGCLQHPSELIRIAAASSYFELTCEPHRLLEVMVKGTDSEDELTQDVAATALARVLPEHARLSELTSGRQPVGGSAEANTTLLIHGTWARKNSWWQPGGDFHSYLSGILPPLPRTPSRSAPYNAGDRFEWSGGWSDAARALGALDLFGWVKNHNAEGLDLITHSHGGSVAMLASRAGMRIGELVLLSCPVHFPKYVPNFSQVQAIVSIRVRLDLVILADGGGQRFRHPQIQENVLPLWFNHSATHEPAVWQRHQVSSRL